MPASALPSLTDISHAQPEPSMLNDAGDTGTHAQLALSKPASALPPSTDTNHAHPEPSMPTSALPPSDSTGNAHPAPSTNSASNAQLAPSTLASPLPPSNSTGNAQPVPSTNITGIAQLALSTLASPLPPSNSTGNAQLAPTCPMFVLLVNPLSASHLTAVSHPGFMFTPETSGEQQITSNPNFAMFADMMQPDIAHLWDNVLAAGYEPGLFFDNTGESSATEFSIARTDGVYLGGFNVTYGGNPDWVPNDADKDFSNVYMNMLAPESMSDLGQAQDLALSTPCPQAVSGEMNDLVIASHPHAPTLQLHLCCSQLIQKHMLRQ
ncbi:hypothetical protein BT96DRAFT_1001882 [Gymnopus androsaceus JB14]|uniref:Uncharacterized protein n=1 Tax=Gymnopus androsaceus JB14 TaxID=1447944 RepID=A0A6A4H0G1_9AGAR|nr:hypothetical protein BT96DRAFT_1001882 [Gymnopus androsaceus JB14]